MSAEYFDLLDSLKDRYDNPYKYLTLQLCFILYLVVGQLVVIPLWRLLSPLTRTWRPWVQRITFSVYLLAAQVVLLFAWPPLIAAWQRADVVLLADALVVCHLGLVLAALLVLVLVPVGGVLGWAWVRNFWLRLVHLVLIEVVAGQAVVGIECPLMTLERELRYRDAEARATEDEPVKDSRWGYIFAKPGEASTVGYWANQTLYYRNLPRLFLAIYIVTGLLVLLTWVGWPPRLPWREEGSAPNSEARGG